MLFTTFSILALLGASQAKPATRMLGVDDLLFLREDGNHEVMKKWEYQIQQDKETVARRRALGNAPREPQPSAGLSKKACEESTEVQVLVDTEFEDNDVAMSPVVGNIGSEQAMVSIAKGYSLADQITVTETVGVTVETILTASLAIGWSETWTTSETTTFTYFVPPGQYGIVISNPLLHRVSGNALSGCTDSPTVDPFESNNYTPVTYGELEWVKGPISMCNSSTYPIPYCIGDGIHQ